jgi:putative ABC transport system permease protein
VIYIDPESFYETAVLLDKGNLNQQVRSVEAVFKKFTPGSPFEYSFLDEDINSSYQVEERTGKIFNYLAGLSIFISCLGLLGIVMFVTEQRAKEVAVRKVLGASVLQLMFMLTIEFIILIVIAFAIATPITWYITSFWLKDFAYHVTPSLFVFALAGLISLIIAWLTIGYKSFQVSRISPVNSLRSD